MKIDLSSPPYFRHPLIAYTLEDAIKLAICNATTFEHPVPKTLQEVREHISGMTSRMNHQWQTGAAALDVLDAVIDGRNIANEGRIAGVVNYEVVVKRGGLAEVKEAVPEELVAVLEEHPEIHVEQVRDGKWNFRHDDNEEEPDEEYFQHGSYATKEEAVRAAFNEYGVEIDELAAARP